MEKQNTKKWLGGLAAGFQLGNPSRVPVPDANNPYLTSNPYEGQGDPPYYEPPGGMPPTSGNKWLLYTGIGLGVIAIVVVIISATKNR